MNNGLNDKQKSFIQELSKDLKPVKRASFTKFLLVWGFVSLASIFVFSLFFGPRPDFFIKMKSGLYLVLLVVLVLSSVLGMWFAFRLSIPGQEPKKVSKTLVLLIPFLLVGVLAIYGLFAFSFSEHVANWKKGWMCSVSVVAVGLLPWFVVSYMISRLAPFRISAVAFLAAMSGIFVGGTIQHVHCSLDGFVHMFMWHFLPILVFCLILMIPARYFLKK